MKHGFDDLHSCLCRLRDCVVALMDIQTHNAMMELMTTLEGVITRERKKHGFNLDEELSALTRRANDWAIDHGRRTVTIKQVEMLDQISTGADWSTKICLRIAEMVFGVSPHVNLPRV